MGGMSFLLKKRFHPYRLDNQEKVFLAEEKQKEKSLREMESKQEIEKEKEILYYENLNQLDKRDERYTSLKFMYIMSNKSNTTNSNNNITNTANNKEDKDVYVEAFYNKLNQIQDNKNNSSSSSHNITNDTNDTNDTNNMSRNNSINDHIKPYDKDIQKIHPSLLNAPVAGSFVKNLSSVKFKPFNDPIRNIQCSHCGQWGHRFNDRECPLKDQNPHDNIRKTHEDPLTYMNAYIDSNDDAKLPNEELLFQAMNDCDNEAQYLSSLSTKEKKILLRKLQILQGDIIDNASDDNDSNESLQEKKKDKHKRKHKHKKKSKHE